MRRMRPRSAHSVLRGGLTRPQAGPPGIVHHLPMTHSACLSARRHYVTIQQAPEASALRLTASAGVASRARRRTNLRGIVHHLPMMHSARLSAQWHYVTIPSSSKAPALPRHRCHRAKQCPRSDVAHNACPIASACVTIPSPATM